MAENLLKEVLRYCKINKESLVKLLTTLGVNNYITICELKSKSFINKISELTEEEFDEIFLCKVGESEPDDDQSFKELNKQVSNKNIHKLLRTLVFWSDFKLEGKFINFYPITCLYRKQKLQTIIYNNMNMSTKASYR